MFRVADWHLGRGRYTRSAKHGEQGLGGGSVQGGKGWNREALEREGGAPEETPATGGASGVEASSAPGLKGGSAPRATGRGGGWHLGWGRCTRSARHG